jgi:hypothetical protein
MPRYSNQEKYEKKMRAQGCVRVSLWVPKEARTTIIEQSRELLKAANKESKK